MRTTLKSQGYFDYYGVAGNSRSVKTFFDDTMKVLFKWLNRRSRKHRMNG